MALQINSLETVFHHSFDAVIDVRSPSEYADDCLPGAVNLPVLSDAERALVGTVYKQQSPFAARKLGASLVFRNAADHVEASLQAHDGAWRPLVYCWRGGQRSGSFHWMLRQIGWRAELVEGGYKSYRKLVMRVLYEKDLPHRFVQLGGYTGTAKTELLTRLRARGMQTLDLEDLARHRGSLLGARDTAQPSQKAFESRLAHALHQMDPSLPVVVEAESSKIGVLNLPPSLWGAMKAAPWIEVHAPMDARATYLAHAYDDILSDAERLRARLQPLRYHRGHALVDQWEALIASDQRTALCASLAADHYDPAYRTSMRAQSPTILFREKTERLGANDLDDLADRIASKIQTTRI